MTGESKLEDRLKDIHGGTSAEDKKDKKVKSALEEAIEAEDRELAADAFRLRLEEKNVQRKVNIKQLKEELRGGKVTKEERGAKTDEKPKRWTVAPDGKPIEDPEGEYETFAQAYKVAALAAAKSADPTAFFKFLKSEGIIGGKATASDFTQDLAKRYLDSIDAQLKAGGKSADSDVISRLESRITALSDEVRASSDPVVIISKAKALTDGLRSAGLIPEPSAGGGGSLEELKEAHRHAEKMEEIKAEVEYKQTVGKTLADIPERIGRGIASQVAGEGEESGGSSSSLTYYTCTEEGCGTKIPVPPEATSIKCPKCGMVYERTKEAK